MSNGLNNAAMALAANALRAALSRMHLHSADPGGDGTANPTSAPSQPVTWAPPSVWGTFGLSAPIPFSGIAPNGPCTWVRLWDATDSIWYGNFALTGDQTANSGGQFNVTALDFTGSAN